MAFEKPDLKNNYVFVSYGFLSRKIERMVAIIDNINLSSPISAKLMLAAACYDANVLCSDLCGVVKYAQSCYMARLYGKPKFATHGQHLLQAIEKLYRSKWADHYWKTQSPYFLDGEEPTKDELAESKQAIDNASKVAKIMLDNLSESCYGIQYGSEIQYSTGEFEKFLKDKEYVLLDLLSFLCRECVRYCQKLHEAIEKPTLDALAKGLYLSNELYKKNRFSDEIDRFNTERDKALDEYDKDTPERLSEEILYLQEKKQELNAIRLSSFSTFWNKYKDTKTGEVDFLAIAKEYYPNSGAYEIMEPNQLCYRFNEVYLYDYITKEIKRLRKIEKDLAADYCDNKRSVIINVDNRTITMTGKDAKYIENPDKE